jgi:hypothetical protein
VPLDLSCLDRLPSNELTMTQELIADMLGCAAQASRRPPEICSTGARALFLGIRFEHAIGRIFANGAIPLRLELWNGRRIDRSPAPTVLADDNPVCREILLHRLNAPGYAAESADIGLRSPGAELAGV